MKHELLVPVGSKESLVSAINGGADAVYLSGKNFGARAYADNFTDDELVDAINIAHLYGVKVYVTVNTLLFDSEIEEALKYIEFLHTNGVDALIMQDVGLINLVHNMYPSLEIHASTQMHVHNEDTLKFLENLGVKRVVFARELTRDYINSIKTPLEKEVFIHGALCISYSGQCLFSSLIMKRSGNRGECAGACRLLYTLIKNGEEVNTFGNYLLSPKELCSIDNFKSLMDSNIKSFKIEGRMKSPLYVYIVTKIYKTLMNQYENNEELSVDSEDYKLLCSIFNREFTSGHLFNDLNIMNIKSSNHLGLKVGTVTDITPKKLKIELTESIKQFDGIRFGNSEKGITLNFIYDARDNLINKGEKGSTIFIDNFMGLDNTCDVYLTSPYVKLDPEITKKIGIDIKVNANVGKRLTVSLSDGINYIEMLGNEVEPAKNYPTIRDDIIRSISKMGNTPFKLNSIEVINDDNVFIPVKELNELRRALIDKLIALRCVHKEIVKIDYNPKSLKQKTISGISVLVRNKNQLDCAKDLGIKRIYVTDESLMDENTILRVPRDSINYEYDVKNLLVTDYGSMYKYQNNYSDYYLNVTNKYSLDYLSNYTKLITLSPELNLEQIKDMNIHIKNVEVIIYGNIELMIMKYCPLNMLLNKDKTCSICTKNDKYYLKDRNDCFYRLISNKKTHSTSLMNSYYIDEIDKMNEYKECGINNFRVELLDQSYDETKRILERVIENERNNN